MTKPLEVIPLKDIKPKLSDFTFGIECENYVTSWRTDHSDTHETVSKKFNNFNSVLIYMRNIVERHKNDEEFMLHSYPEDKESSCSAHIHLKCNIPEWNEYKYHLYTRLHNLVKIYSIFFKNSPDKDNKIFSRRHKEGQWCQLIKLEEQSFLKSGRHYTALTLNPSFDTIEFRYNEIPKHLNQLALYYYLLSIAINDDIDIPEIPDNMEIHTFKSLAKPLNKSRFSYKDKNSIIYHNTSYMRLMQEFSQVVDTNLPYKFYDFIHDKYSPFYKWIGATLKYDLDNFREYFDRKDISEEEWSDKLKNKFCKLIKKELIK